VDNLEIDDAPLFSQVAELVDATVMILLEGETPNRITR